MMSHISDVLVGSSTFLRLSPSATYLDATGIVVGHPTSSFPFFVVAVLVFVAGIDVGSDFPVTRIVDFGRIVAQVFPLEAKRRRIGEYVAIKLHLVVDRSAHDSG